MATTPNMIGTPCESLAGFWLTWSSTSPWTQPVNVNSTIVAVECPPLMDGQTNKKVSKKTQVQLFKKNKSYPLSRVRRPHCPG